jgi:methionyl-tRNA formyltransferase
MEALRIVFMGTPEFAVGILDTILQNNYTVVGVITAPDKPAGRGQQIKYSAVRITRCDTTSNYCNLPI